MAAGLVAALPVAWLSALVADCLFGLNAPEADQSVKRGFGFMLYYAAAAGWFVGAVTAYAIVGGNGRTWIWTGAISGALLAAIAGWLSEGDPFNEIWVGPDLMSVPLILAVLLLIAGIVIQRLQRGRRQSATPDV